MRRPMSESDPGLDSRVVSEVRRRRTFAIISHPHIGL